MLILLREITAVIKLQIFDEHSRDATAFRRELLGEIFPRKRLVNSCRADSRDAKSVGRYVYSPTRARSIFRTEPIPGVYD